MKSKQPNEQQAECQREIAPGKGQKSPVFSMRGIRAIRSPSLQTGSPVHLYSPMCRLPQESGTWMARAKESVVNKEDGSDRGTQRDHQESH